MGMLRRWRAFSYMLLAATAGAGCGTKAATADAEGTPRPLCPDCSSAGGESTDFDGETFECCLATRGAVGFDDPRAIALGAERSAQLIEAGYEGPFEWQRSWGSSRASGYAAETHLSLNASVEGLEYVDQELSPTSNPLVCRPENCGDYLAFATHVEVSTADGGVTGSGKINLMSFAPDEVQGSGGLPIESFSGNLDLGVEAPQTWGVVGLRAYISESGFHGSLTPLIFDAENPADTQSRSSPLIGHWPLPWCDDRFPFDHERLVGRLDAPLASADGRTARELSMEFREAPIGQPMPATWLDGSRTELSVELAGNLEQACSGGPDRMQLVTTLHVSTSDGRLDLLQPDGSCASRTRFPHPGLGVSRRR